MRVPVKQSDSTKTETASLGPSAPRQAVTPEEIRLMIDLWTRDHANLTVEAADTASDIASVAEALGISLDEAERLRETVAARRADAERANRDAIEAERLRTEAQAGLLEAQARLAEAETRKRMAEAHIAGVQGLQREVHTRMSGKRLQS